jgi:RsmE family RNA methyltransferase
MAAASGSDLEATYQALQVNPQARQLGTGSRSFFAGRRGLFGNVPHVEHAAVDLFGHGALLLGGGGDLLVHRLDRRDGTGDVLQGIAGPTGQLDAAVGQAATVVHDGRHLLGAALQADDQLFDFLGGLLRPLGQAAHFIGNHRKTASGLTGARRFNRCVKGQQVGLLGHRLDDVQHTADLVALTLEMAHGFGGVAHLAGQALDLGDSLRVGRIGGLMGNAQLLRLEAREAELEVTFDLPPPAKLPLTLLLALPRPKMLRRVLQTVASMGVPRVVLVNSYRVEKSFWQTPFLEPEAIREQLILGLEQARDTVLPEIVIEKRFKPFVEDRLPAMAQGTLGLIGHPGDYPPCPRGLDEPVTLAIGPEGGWIPYEVDLLAKAGLQPVQLGARILRVETAVTALLARLF